MASLCHFIPLLMNVYIFHFYHFFDVNNFSPTWFAKEKKNIENGDTNVKYLVIKLYIIYMKKCL